LHERVKIAPKNTATYYLLIIIKNEALFDAEVRQYV